MADASAGPPPSVDAQDPLPESNWTFRRLLAFLIVALWGFNTIVTGDRIAGSGADPLAVVTGLLNFQHWNTAVLVIIVLLYMVAPSAEQVVKMMQTVGALKAGVNFAATQTATSPAGGAAGAQTLAGKDVTPPAPPPGPAIPPVGTELPVSEAPAYEGPDMDERPVAPANVPEDAQWAR